MNIKNELVQDIFFKPIRINKTFWVILLLICSLSAGAFSFYKAAHKVGKTFPGFFVGANLMVSVSQRATWPGIQAGLQPLDKILAVNAVPVSNIEEFQRIVSSAREGKPFSYLIERGGVKSTISIPVRKTTPLDFLISFFLAPFSIGLIFLILGAVTVFYVPDERISYIYFILCSLIGIFCLVFYEAFTSYTFFRITQLYPFIAAVSVHLFSVFPENKPISQKRYFLTSLVYGFAVMLVLLRQYYLYDQDISIVLSKISSFFVGITLVINLVLLIESHLKATTNLAKDKTKVLIAGLVIASSAVGLWSLNFIFKRASFYLDEAILISLIFPIFLSYAILKKNIFDMDHVIRVSLTYGASAGVVLLAYFVIVTMVGFIWPSLLGIKSLVGIFAILTMTGAMVFKPLTRKVRVLIYKLLFRAKYDRLQSLMEYGKRLSIAVDRDEISKLLVSDTVELMGLKGAFLLTYLSVDPDRPRVERSVGISISDTDLPDLDRGNSPLLRLLSKADKPQFLGDLRTVRTEREVEPLKKKGAKIVVPIRAKGELLGLLFLLEKISLDIFTAEDLEFLGALAHQAAVSLENAKLYIEKAKQERLAAIGQVASVIIHEIKNPLGVIKVSSGALRKKFKETDQGFELATFIQKEADRMNSTIQQILNFAKPMDSRISEFLVKDLVEDALREVERASEERRITFDYELEDEEMRLSADMEKLRRALINLLINAKQASKEGDIVKIKVRKSSENGTAKESEAVEITVEDRGEGIEENDMSHLFQPFFTTRQEGTGLGLAIVNQIAKDHGGEVTVRSKRGEGSTFSIRLPVKKID